MSLMPDRFWLRCLRSRSSRMTSFFARPSQVPFGGHSVQFLQTLDGFLYRGHVGQQSAQPALVDEVLTGAQRFFGNRFLSLPLGAHEKNGFALRGHFAHVAHRVLEEFESFLKIYDVDPITFAKDVFFHLWIPALGLVPEVNAGFEQFFHTNRRQNTSLPALWLNPDSTAQSGICGPGKAFRR